MSDPFDFDKALDRAAANPHETPALLLREAEKLFATRGFEGVRTRDVASAAGVNVSTLHFHWKDKLTLYEAVGRSFGRQVFGFVADLVRELQALDLSEEELLDRWIDWSTDLLAEHPLLARMYLRRMLDGRPLSGMNDTEYGASEVRLMQAAVEQRIDKSVRGDLDVALFIYSVLYSSVVIFADADIQRSVLGGSVFEDPALRERLKEFARDWFRRMVIRN